MKRVYYIYIMLFICELIQAQGSFAFNFSSPQELQSFLRYDTHFPVYIHAHRGGGYTNYPENCIETFDYTLRYIPAFIEVDPRVTKDGVVVLMHDAKIDRTTTGMGNLCDYTYKELQSFNLKDKNGKITNFKIPTFEESLRWAKGKSVLIIDKKDADLSKILDIIKKENAESNVILMAYSIEDAKSILKFDPSLTLQVFAKDEKALNNLESNNIPLTNVVAFINHSYPEDPDILNLLHQRNVKTVLGTSRNIDKEFDRGDNKAYRKLVDMNIDIIEADNAIEAGMNFIELYKTIPVVKKYVSFKD